MNKQIIETGNNPLTSILLYYNTKDLRCINKVLKSSKSVFKYTLKHFLGCLSLDAIGNNFPV